VATKKKESGSLGEMVRRGAERLARNPRLAAPRRSESSSLYETGDTCLLDLFKAFRSE
jgi:hypothetical protein